MDYDDEAAREGEPSDAAKVGDEESDTTDAGETEGFPLGSHPCGGYWNAVLSSMQSSTNGRFRQGYQALLREHEAPQANLGDGSDRCQ